MATELIEVAVRSFLLGKPPVVALVGDRIRPFLRPQKDRLPALTVEAAQEVFQDDLADGDGAGVFVTARVLVTAWSTDVIEARQLAELVRTNGDNPGTGLAGFSGVLGTAPNDLLVQHVRIVERESGWDPEPWGEDREVYTVETVFEFEFELSD